MHLQLDDLTYSYPHKHGFTLGPLTLNIEAGTVTALIGSNGSGKTTLIKVLLNELNGYTGSYRIDGEAISDRFANLMSHYRIGYAPEFPVLEERLTGSETMLLLREIHQIPDEEFKLQIDECRKELNCEEWFDTIPGREYSQGMRKKLSLMIALVGNPRFIVIDEPTNGLDPLASFGLKKLLSRYRDRGIGTLVSSHMLDFVERVAEQVIILKKGSAIISGTVQKLFSSYPGMPLDAIYYKLFMDNSSNADI